MKESAIYDKKSLKVVMGKTADWNELAKDCVAFANLRGGTIDVGIENKAALPESIQTIPEDLPAIIHKRISELTINVGVVVNIQTAENGGQFVRVQILYSASTIASTTDGRYYIRSGDTTVPLLPDEFSRLFTDKPAFIWEIKQVKSVLKNNYDEQKLAKFVYDIRHSNRVSTFVKEKNPEELLEYYLMSDGDFLTNLGVLWVGKRNDRAKLSYAPIVQFLKYDETGNRVNKIVWDDYSLNPAELLEAVWTQIPDWKEGIEVSDGLFRKFIANYPERVVRELFTNALVHRPYTTRGDVFINLYPDRVEICNPGLLPVGVTPQNILHKSVRRNEKLSQVFYDLILMEREGSGYDAVYEELLTNGKQIPQTIMGDDSVKVIVKKQIAKPEIISFINRINLEYQLRQKENISLGLLAQNQSCSAVELSSILNQNDKTQLRNWLGRLLDLGLVEKTGKGKGTQYAVSPELIRKSNFKRKTNLKNIEDYRLEELIRKDITAYPHSGFSEIHQRIGEEINQYKVKRMLKNMVEKEILGTTGETRGLKYHLKQNMQENG
jgi:ATP-dependent DNA helicase RecG